MNKLYTDKELRDFIKESNRIEGIKRAPLKKEIEEAERFLSLDVVRQIDLEIFVAVYQPNAVLRRDPGRNVRVGDHIAPPGGPDVVLKLEEVLKDANNPLADPFWIHMEYENLHPFTDGNGRSGRILWAWQMVKQDCWPFLKLGFLHAYYYQTLSAVRKGL